MTTKLSFSGRCIALPETRELDLFADMLEVRGATTLRCPLINIFDAPDAAPIEAWLQQCINGQFDDLILLTGEGLRRLLGFAEREGIQAEFIAALARMRKITRGPKPARELRRLGLSSDLSAVEPTTAGIIRSLEKESLAGHRVAVQLYGENPNRPLIDFIENAGAIAIPVAPYIYADAADSEKVEELILALKNRQVDAIAFTSSPQIERLFSVARKKAMLSELQAGLDQCCVAAVGPLVAEALRNAEVRVDLMPEDNYFLKPMVNALAKYWNRHH